MEKGTVVKIEKKNQWSGDHGTFDCYDITIRNEANIELEGSTMTPEGKDCKFKLDQECQFTKTDNGKYGFKFKWASEQGGFGGKSNFDPNLSVRQTAFNGIIQLVCHGKLEVKDITRELVDSTTEKIKV